jgi:hypothetical protein
MASTFTSGQTLRCTIERVPQTEDDQQTILRLMRKDPAVAKRLRRSQMMRRRHMVVYNRGNRDWYKRETVGKVANVTKGAQWSFTFNHDLGRDMEVVKDYLKVEAV